MSPDHIRLPFVAIAGPDELPVDDVAARSPNPPKFAADHAPPFDSTRTVPVFHKRITSLIGPKVSEHFFKARDTEMSQKEVWFATSTYVLLGSIFSRPSYLMRHHGFE